MNIELYPIGEVVSDVERPSDMPLTGKMAMNQHQEECIWLHIGVRLALLADEHFGKIQSPDIKVKVTGPGCLADVIQGLTHSRLSNPQRFEYVAGTSLPEILFADARKTLKVKLHCIPALDELTTCDDEGLFVIKAGTVKSRK